MANNKDFQEKTITAPVTSVDFVSPVGVVSVSGDFDGGLLLYQLTGDTNSFSSTGIARATFVNAQRVTFNVVGGMGNHDLTIRWYPVSYPY